MNKHNYCVKQLEVFFGSDDRYIKEVLEKREYDFYLLGDSRDLVIIDAGANVGSFTWSILFQIKRAYLIEPIHSCVEFINETIKTNNLHNISVHEFALGNSVETRGFFNTEDSQTGSSSFFGGNNCEVQVKDIQTFMNEENIGEVDLMKVDIECAELELFESDAFSQVCPLIKNIIGERHGDRNIQAPLEKNGYKYTDLGGRFIAQRL